MTALLLGSLFGVGAVCLALSLYPPPPSLRRLAQARRVGGTVALRGRPSLREVEESRWTKRLRLWLEKEPRAVSRRFAHWVPAERTTDLRVSGMSVGHMLSGGVLPALILGWFLFFPMVLFVVLAKITPLIFLLLPPVIAGLAFLLVRLNLQSEARQARREFSHALAAYLELVAIALVGGGEPDEEMTRAADAGKGWQFLELQRLLGGRRLEVRRPWEQMVDLGRELGVRELEELTSSVALADKQGASISDSLTSRARSMRSRRLAEAEGAAGKKSEQMSLAVAIFAIGLLLFVLFPVGDRLLDDADIGRVQTTNVTVPNGR